MRIHVSGYMKSLAIKQRHHNVCILVLLVTLLLILVDPTATAPVTCTVTEDCEAVAESWCAGRPRCNKDHGACEQLLRCPDPAHSYCNEATRECLTAAPLKIPSVGKSMLTSLALSTICNTLECCINQTHTAYKIATNESLPWCIGEVELNASGKGCRILQRCYGPRFRCDETKRACVFQSTTIKSAFVPCTSDSDCSDGIFCNGVETCSTGECTAALVSACPSGSTCDETRQSCSVVQPTSNFDTQSGIVGQTTLIVTSLVTIAFLVCLVAVTLLRPESRGDAGSASSDELVMNKRAVTNRALYDKFVS